MLAAASRDPANSAVSPPPAWTLPSSVCRRTAKTVGCCRCSTPRPRCSPPRRYRCGNDMVCGWAGALAGEDGINVVCGTGSIAYGEYRGRTARSGGWGELFGDEGSAYWIAREGLTLFSRMSDGRAPRGALYEILRRHFSLQDDLDLCAAIYGQSVRAAQPVSRPVQARRARRPPRAMCRRAPCSHRRPKSWRRSSMRCAANCACRIASPCHFPTPAACSGWANSCWRRCSSAREPQRGYRLLAARLPPDAGAALHAAKLAGAPLPATSIGALEAESAGAGSVPG